VKSDFLRQRFPKAIKRWALPLAITAFLWFTRSNEITVVQLSLAFFLLCVPWQAYINWKTNTKSYLPLFAMVTFMYWLYYVVPLFWEPQTISEVSAPLGRELSQSSITESLWMVALGVSSLWIGMRVGFGRRLSPRRLSIELPQSRRSYIRAVLAVGCLLNFYDVSPYTLGEGGRQLINLLLAVVPMLTFAVLFHSYLKREATYVDKVLMLAFLVTRLFNGFSSGWLGVSMSLIMMCGVIFLADRRRLPAFGLIAVVLLVLFFQVGKEEFRNVYWKEGTQAGRIERTTFWMQASMQKWLAVWDDPSGQALKDAVTPSVSRVSLLNQTADVIELTPSVVPYQYGRLYSYLGVTLIPRFLWPNKPSMNEANQFYQVAYDLTTEDELSRVSIAVGTLTEGYINFSWPGALGIMFLLGVFFDFFQSTFLSAKSGPLLKAIGVVLLLPFLAIESQLAQYLGGIIQEVVVVFIVMLPAVRITRSFGRLPVWQPQQ